jgi:hypothetical protein
MANTDKRNEGESQAIGNELGSFFKVGPQSAGLGVAESFQVWGVSFDDFLDSLLAKASWQGVWHHQIGTTPGEARAYARSVDGLDKQVRAVFPSPLAAELDRAITAVDGDDRFAAEGLIARLCVIPELNFTALWINDAENSMIPLGRYARSDDSHFMPEPASSVRERLKGGNKVEGLIGKLKC